MKICNDFKRGHCSYGAKCKFVHPQGQQESGRHHPYPQGRKNTRPSNDEGGHGPQRRNDNRQQQHGSRQQQQQHSRQKDSRQQDGRQQQKGATGGRTTPMSPTDSYPQPLSDTPTDDQQQQQQQPQQQPPQRLQQGITALDRARAMCKLLNMGNPGPLVTPETEASAINAFACGGFFRETPFADSIERFLPSLKQQ